MRNRLVLLTAIAGVVAGCAADPCDLMENADGSYTLSCPDSDPITLRDGMDGTDGMDGMDGEDGTAYLIRTEDEPAGENCANGGIAVLVGPDDDGNGALGDGEVTSTRYVCDGANGADGEDGTPSLIATADEPAGMNCEFGGVVITSGLDADGSGTLEPAEVSSTQYVCDGAGGAGVVLDFPSEDSSLDNTFTVEPLGAGGGGAAYVAGSSVSESFTDTGLPSVTGLTYEFEMDDSTNSSCPVGTLSFDIVLNGVTVDSYSFEGGSDMGTIGFSGGVIFPAIDGGATGDYDLEIVANETVCGGGGSYNWFAGGAFVLRP